MKVCVPRVVALLLGVTRSLDEVDGLEIFRLRQPGASVDVQYVMEIFISIFVTLRF